VRLIPASSNLASSLINIRSKSYVVDKVFADLKELEQAVEVSRTDLPRFRQSQLSPGAHALSFTGSIQLNQVSYAYPGSSQKALANISINIQKGQSVAFIGKSGAGKTTLVDVLLGILKPSGGDILVDGVSIYGSLESWRKLIGYMPQSVHLIDDSLIKNVALGVPEPLIDYDKIKQCIRSAQLEDVVANLSEGLHTSLGERGVRLSGGQRQRVGIARALYHGSNILIMDEATSALDSETEALITEAIKSLSQERTIIVIAHRLSTIEHCDQVFLLDEGRLTKTGSYAEVVAGKR
ncbi:MAG: ATP-binding cassette domain-containing protein, partial [Cyanobacteria bacterium J06576_12]